MSREFACLLAGQFNLSPEEKDLLFKTVRELGRKGRRVYFQRIRPREKEFKRYLQQKLAPGEESRWVEVTARSLLARGGEPDLADRLVMDVVGRLKVYRYTREKAEEEGVHLRPLANFGGLAMVLVLAMLVVSLVLYFLNRGA